MFPRAVIIVFCASLVCEVLASCGNRQINILTSLIRKGYNTKAEEWPWHAAIYHKVESTYNYVCGGTLIGTDYVLTAAHCTVNETTGSQRSKESILVRLGVRNLDDLSPVNVQQSNIAQIHTHPFYKSGKHNNDIALLQLESPAAFNAFVQPACVSQLSDLSDKTGTLVGWGRTEDSSLAHKLQSAQLPVIHTIKCIASNPHTYGPSIDEGMLCTGHLNGTSVCNGDSGSGLFFEQDDVWSLGVIVSFAAKEKNSTLCSTQDYAVFTNVKQFLPWIVNVTGPEKTEYLYVPDTPSYAMPPSSFKKPYVVITEQPEPCGAHFENRTIDKHGSRLRGVHTTPQTLTYPTIQIREYTDRAVVVLSCVSKDHPYRPHPNALVGDPLCKDGVYTGLLESNTFEFSNLIIRRTPTEDIERVLRVRQGYHVDPFNTGFNHADYPAYIDLNAVRLCFQVFLESAAGRYTIPLLPVVSDVIYDMDFHYLYT